MRQSYSTIAELKQSSLPSMAYVYGLCSLMAFSVDPLARRLAWLTGFPEKRIQLIYPLLLPLGIWLTSIGFTGAAFNECNREQDKSQPSDRQPLEKQIADWMAEQQKHIGRYPTQKEAAQYFGISESTVSRKLAEVKADASG